MTTQPKPLTLRDHEVKQLLSTGDVLIVRPVKPQPWWIEPPHLEGDRWIGVYSKDTDITNPTYQARCPYPVGSRWWVRETWVQPYEWIVPGYDPNYHGALYKASSFDTWGCGYSFDWDDIPDRFWRSAITMPRWASRLTVEVVENGVGRVRELTYRDICRMGYAGMPEDSDEPMDVERYAAVKWLRETWDRHNPKYPYSSNPWVWVAEFRRIQ